MPASTHRVEPLAEPPDAVVAVPGSKSITNRALVCAALAGGASTLRGIGLSDDTEAMLDAIARLGADVRVDPLRRRRWSWGRPVHCDPVRSSSTPASPARRRASSPRWPRSVTAGTASTAASPSATRPMAPLHDALRRARRGHRARVVLGPPPGRRDGRRSPGRRGGPSGRRLEPVRHGPAARRPRHRAGHPDRADLPAGLPALPGHHAGRDGRVRRRRRGGGGAIGHRRRPAATAGPTTAIEPDASSASYLLAAAAITGGRVAVPGLGPAPLQGDAAFVDLLGRMGAGVERAAGVDRPSTAAPLHGIDVDMADFPTRRRPSPRWPRSPTRPPASPASGSSAARRPTASGRS